MTSFTSCFTVFAEEMDLNLDNIAKYLNRGTGIGKILKRMKLHDENVQAGVLAFRSSEYASQIEFTSDFSDIEAAYGCIDSCMTNYAQKCAEFYSHPLLVAQGIKVALFCQHGQIMGRCVVNTQTMVRNPVYTFIGYEEFQVGLAELGYQVYDDCSSSALSGVDIPIGQFYPYFDGTGYLVHSNSGSYVLESLGDGYLDFSEVMTENIISEFESLGHSVTASELWVWSGCFWMNYGRFYSDANLRTDWEMSINRTDEGYLLSSDELFIFDDYGNLVGTNKSPTTYRFEHSQYHELPGLSPWSADEKPLCPSNWRPVKQAKEELWWHSEVGVISYDAFLKTGE